MTQFVPRVFSMNASGSSQSSKTSFRPTSFEYSEANHIEPYNRFHPYQYLPLEARMSSSSAQHDPKSALRPDVSPYLARQSKHLERDSVILKRQDLASQGRHETMETSNNSASQGAIRTISNSYLGHSGETPNYGLGWMNSPILERSRRVALHGNGHILPRVQNSISDRRDLRHSGDLHYVYAFGRNADSTTYRPYSLQNLHSSGPMVPKTLHVHYRDMTPPSPKELRVPQDHVMFDHRPGSPSPSSYNYNNHVSPVKRSSLPKNLADLDLSSKNQLEEIRRIYDKKTSPDHVKLNNQSSRRDNKPLRKSESNGDFRGAWSKSKRGEYPTLEFKFTKDFGYGDGLGMGKMKESVGDSSLEPSVRIREGYDESHRRRKRNHIIFLVIVMVIVAVAVISAVLAATLGSTSGRQRAGSQNYSIVVANLTLKILNRGFQEELLDSNSQEFKDLSASYSIEIDRLFQTSNLAEVYSQNEILYFRNGSIYATSSITFVDEGLVKTSRDVENVISAADFGSEGKHDDLVQLGEFFVCRSCAEVQLEFVTVNEKPKVLAEVHDPDLSAPLLSATAKLPSLITSEEDTVANTTKSFVISSTSNTDDENRITTVKSVTNDSPDSTSSHQNQENAFTPTSVPDGSTSGDTYQNIRTGIFLEALSVSQDVAKIRCLTKNFSGWTNISIWHLPLDAEPVLIMSLKATGVTTYGPLYSSRVESKYDFNETHITLTTTLSQLECHDLSSVQCVVTDKTGARLSRTVTVDVANPVSATRPKLTVPHNIIENKRMTNEVTCEAMVGHPAWTMSMWAHLRNGSVYSLPAEDTLLLDNCVIRLVSSLSDVVPTLAMNGTVLRCEVHQPGRTTVFSDTQTLLVVEETVCEGKPNQSYVPHPYNCSSYILCVNEVPTIQLCPDGQCFDNYYKRCGANEVPLIVQVSHGVLNQGLAFINCSVSTKLQWTEMKLSQTATSGQSTELLRFNSIGTVTWADIGLESRAVTKLKTLKQRHQFQVWIYELKCLDEGNYTCLVRSELMELTESAQLRVQVKPEVPKITVTGTPSEGGSDSVVVKCEANLGRPASNMTLTIRSAGETEFRPVPFSKMTDSPSSCMNRQTGEYDVEPASVLNGSVFRCEVSPSRTFGKMGTLLSEENEYFVLSNETCAGRAPSLLSHPRDCRLFVQCAKNTASVFSCGSNICFNVTSLLCDIVTSATAAPDINDNSCSPEKNGVYLPHKSLCNKFIQCTYGKEINGHCPRGHVYARDGQCTTDIDQSYCFLNYF
ncbi:uncharacterized protein LOC106056372 isoform X1 [Biomphalaria glabrata]|uniref:Uncharacterized protein LOC106056372 isoform X1 n=1 Tax=Biomphalaria glabrata TaxID=6526 RepID=A0A9U8E1M1_BIOGL|nr:uncharacterized protein LOC106056372 isoform X1 [Biomphalaria glabrata]XP_013068530.2 uncharacterized protein LOC106056372 isoform X1 [Biomphalaria glabrata]